MGTGTHRLMRKMAVLFPILALLAASARLIAANPPVGSLPREELQKEIVAVKKDDFLLIPHAYYKPETQIAGGLVFLSYFRIGSDFPLHIRPSTLATTLTYTQRKQFIWQLFPEFYLDNEKYHLVGELEYYYYPNYFYGIGNETREEEREGYASSTVRFRSDLQREIAHRLYLGFVYHYERTVIEESEEGGAIESKDVPGSDSSRASGIGLSLNLDTRDNGFSPTRGGLYQFSAVSFDRMFGSRYQFIRHTLDLRKYLPLWRGHVLALQGYANVIYGEAPFEMLSLMGGKKLMRGLFEGRYRDNAMVVTQGEYRFPLWWRFGAVAFAGVGDVARRVQDFEPDEFKFTYGGGLRFSINPQEKINMRLDVGRSSDLTGFYITIGEAY
ncbi:MAG TPA: BamA/TamA family outer membrane protein [Spirochaetota bacterium]|nr:BamA/TamA family outer membrane protein [Spirochaetota bacterium]OPZ34850.1 MAG: Outer membrane protein assembly factor BamA [Spirochaetes bacterium ADurb.BinA120]HNU93084.1 BamA/TamA family outer membrane protein [Spirochaetota bacterium]HPV98825.1 BamA/TamA family outer membrane protein [Spirochaetota bacterium]